MSARTHLAWLIWCFTEDYVKAEDRVILTNWVDDDPSLLTAEDRALRTDLLGMADEVLAALAACAPDEANEAQT